MQERSALVGAIWRKSGVSGDGNCVEVASAKGAVIGVRDSKDAGGGVLAFSPSAWAAFMGCVKSGRLDGR
ncbi:DUF397 domain-containing protein [Plantactinospora sp. WMMB334]|uniref:DUF397 domain-containing protein n=1 Tax=Plantactinospora sp. WMMB334 TaxID=3404119 RepID=UPI003B9226C9